MTRRRGGRCGSAATPGPSGRASAGVCWGFLLGSLAAGLSGAAVAQVGSADLDGDRIPNSIESAAGLDPTDPADAALDLDGDGWSNLDEYRFGSGIGDPESSPVGVERQKVFASDGGAGDGFGSVVSLSGAQAIIGAPQDGEEPVGAGAAYVFIESDGVWSQQAKLTASDGQPGDLFGASAAVFGSNAIVGAPGRAGGGAAYWFNRDGDEWSEAQILAGADTEAGDRLGTSLAGETDWLVVGSTGDDDRGDDAGAAYLFQLGGGGWAEVEKLTASDGEAGDEFGMSVALSGGTIAIGAPFSSPIWPHSGSVYVFEHDGASFAEPAKLTPQSSKYGVRFGWSVAVSSDWLLAGAPGSTFGAAYFFRRQGGQWNEDGPVYASDRASNDHFGQSVALRGSFAVVGADLVDDPAEDAGAAYIFSRVGQVWTENAKFTAREGAEADSLGFAVARDQDWVLVGALLDDDAGGNSGSAYFYSLDCGDGEVTGAEQCDDGNRVSEDGCSALCLAEFCGDGVELESMGEACDDGNTSSEDGCSATCQREWCGDTVIQPGLGEECDDGGQVYQDGCSPTCQLEYCGDQVVQGLLGEQCDDGGTQGDDGCTAACQHENLDSDPYPDLLDADVDGDGLPNDVETWLGLDPRDPDDGSLDLDGDGVGNSYEFRFGGAIDDGLVFPSTPPTQQRVFAGQLERPSPGTCDEGDGFGRDVEVQGNTAVVAGCEAVYVYRKEAGIWHERHRLPVYGPGWVGLSGDVLASTGDPNNSEVFVFRRSGGTWKRDSRIFDGFPAWKTDVAIDGDRLMLGRRKNRSNPEGRVYLYERRDGIWEFIRTIQSAGREFGLRLDLAGDVAVMSGARDVWVHALADGVWSEQLQVRRGDFGTPVVSGGQGFVGTNFHPMNLQEADGTWRASWVTEVGDMNSELAMDVDRGHMIVGEAPPPGAVAGSVHFYALADGIWEPRARVGAPPAIPSESHYGNAVALSAVSAIVGAPGDLWGLGSVSFIDLRVVPEPNAHLLGIAALFALNAVGRRSRQAARERETPGRQALSTVASCGLRPLRRPLDRPAVS